MIQLTTEQGEILKGLLAQLMANQVNTNLQSIVNINQNCLSFIAEIEKQKASQIEKVEPAL